MQLQLASSTTNCRPTCHACVYTWLCNMCSVAHHKVVPMCTTDVLDQVVAQPYYSIAINAYHVYILTYYIVHICQSASFLDFTHLQFCCVHSTDLQYVTVLCASHKTLLHAKLYTHWILLQLYTTSMPSLMAAMSSNAVAVLAVLKDNHLVWSNTQATNVCHGAI